jgi:hypothetical protein
MQVTEKHFRATHEHDNVNSLQQNARAVLIYSICLVPTSSSFLIAFITMCMVKNAMHPKSCRSGLVSFIICVRLGGTKNMSWNLLAH